MPCFKKPWIWRCSQRLRKLFGSPTAPIFFPEAVVELFDELGLDDQATRSDLLDAASNPEEAKDKHRKRHPNLRFVQNDRLAEVVWVLLEDHLASLGRLLVVDWRSAPEDMPKKGLAYVAKCCAVKHSDLPLPQKARDRIRALNDLLKANAHSFVDLTPGSDTARLLVVHSQQADDVVRIAKKSKLRSARAL